MFRFLAAATLAATISTPAFAQNPLKSVQLSRQLYDHGVLEGDALLIIAAAKLRKNVTPAPSGTTPAGETPHLAWQDMLATAATLAKGDETLEGLVDDLRVATTKGIVNGPVYSISDVRSGGENIYADLPFEGATYAEVYLEGQSNSDLNLYVYDAKGRLVCSDTDISDIAYCGWRPAQTGNFELRVENKGPSASRYSLMTN
ncbi:MAG: hypothetical protein ACWA47_03315 [Brevirhabdus sp.]